MSAYFVVNCAIKDLDLLNEYAEEAMATLGGFSLKLLAGDNSSEVVEGEAGARTVILEFPSKDEFKKWYHSPAYQAVIGKRLEATEGFAVVVDGLG